MLSERSLTLEPLLTVEKLTKVYSLKGKPDLTAVDGVSFTLMRGECLGLIGESGSGKSTIANMITGLVPPTSGRILLEGRDIASGGRRVLLQAYRRMQMVFQSPADSFDPRRTLGYSIGESLRNMGLSRREADAEAKQLLLLCGLDPSFARRYPHEVSGGQCQRAAIARALAVKPALLICDEATSALDVTIQKEIITLLTKLREQSRDGLSILFISHDIALVQQFCSRALVLYKGRLVEEGEPCAIISCPKNDYTRRLIDSIL